MSLFGPWFWLSACIATGLSLSVFWSLHRRAKRSCVGIAADPYLFFMLFAITLTSAVFAGVILGGSIAVENKPWLADIAFLISVTCVFTVLAANFHASTDLASLERLARQLEH